MEEKDISQPEQERKKGLKRVWEVLDRDTGRLLLCGWLACLGLIPWLLGMRAAMASGRAWMVLPVGALGGAIAGPQLTCLADRVLRGLRDDTEGWWSCWKRVWKRDALGSLLPGALTGVLLGIQAYAISGIAQGMQISALAMLLVCLEVDGILLWMWMQLPVIPEGFSTILKNAVMLSVLHFPRTLGAVLVCLAYGWLVWMFWPISQIPLLLLQLWLPALGSMALLYRSFDRVFSIEKRLCQQSGE